MKYLFFDCECANSFDKISKICSIGYCLSDINFNLIKKEDILINPEAPFDYHLFNQKFGINLSYTKKEFYKSPNFKHYYGYLKKLFLDDVVVFGFSLDNDIKFILDDLKRYNLEIFDFKYVDVQILYRLYSKESLNTSLDKALFELGIDVSKEVLHKSDDDAYMTLLVLKGIMDKLNNYSLLDILNKYNLKIESVKGFIKKRNERILLKEKRGQEYLENKNKLHKLNDLYNKSNENPISNKYKGMCFAFSKQVIKFCDKALLAQKVIYDNGGITKRDFDENTILILGFQENIDSLKENNIKYIHVDKILG